MRMFAITIIAVVLVVASFSSASGQASITITGADHVRDLASTGSSGVATAAVEVTARIQFESPNTMRIVPLPKVPGALVAALAEVPYRLYLPAVLR